MDYLLDSELAAVAPCIPRIDLADVAAARKTVRQFSGSAPAYEPTKPLLVQDVSITGEQEHPR